MSYKELHSFLIEERSELKKAVDRKVISFDSCYGEGVDTHDEVSKVMHDRIQELKAQGYKVINTQQHPAVGLMVELWKFKK